MFKPSSSCPKCGGIMKFHWQEGEKSSGMDIRPLKPSGMKETCVQCGFSQLTEEHSKMNAYQP